MIRNIGVLLLLLAAGCGEEQSCTLIGCTDGWTLRIQASTDDLAPGVYALTTTLDGVESMCSWEVRLACDGGGACVVDGDCVNGVYTAKEVAVAFDGAPAMVSYSLTRGGLQIASEDLMPTYGEVRPNGPDCEPVCHQATTIVTID